MFGATWHLWHITKYRINPNIKNNEGLFEEVESVRKYVSVSIYKNNIDSGRRYGGHSRFLRP